MTKIVLAASAAFMAVCAFGTLFTPQELLAFLGVPRSGAALLIVQLLAATFSGFAIANWMAKDSRMGGIYNRPLALANLLHFMIGAITFVKAFVAGTMPAAFATVAIFYIAFAIAFAAVVFRPAAEPAA
ncbi:MAG TPA: hypothetical protein VJ032_11545 [Thermoanaerobaculia bacterium]|nr:hypothetical protein [Thermoanaerobaculia bacterium]